MRRFSKNTYSLFLTFLIPAIFCFYQTTAAQSGRRVNKKTQSSEQKTTVESTPSQTENEVRKNESPVRISSLLVVGEVQHNFRYYNSNEIDIALKELVRTLKSSAKPLAEINKGSGKLKYKEAKELAELQTGTFVLWLAFSAKDDGYGNMYIASVQYAVLMPKTAQILTRGEIDPGQNKVVTSGGVLQLPTGRKNTATALLQMKQGAREIAAILLRGGWLD